MLQLRRTQQSPKRPTWMTIGILSVGSVLNAKQNVSTRTGKGS